MATGREKEAMAQEENDPPSRQGEDLETLLTDRIRQLSAQQQKELLRILEESFGPHGRRNVRKDILGMVDYQVEDRFFQDFVKDISAGGMFIETRHELAAGEEIHMSFMLPGHPKPFKVSGEVVRAGPSGIGVKFWELTPDQAALLKYIVEKL